jgi:hypothetical protein
MLKITPAFDPAMLGGYCKKCGKLPGPEFYLYRAEIGDKTIAACLFEVMSNRVAPLFYESLEGDEWLFDAVLRAGYNYASEQGIAEGSLPEAFRQAHGGYFRHLNYPAQTAFSIANFFKRYKSCGK